MQIAILGRQPKLGTAELEKVYGQNNVTLVSSNIAEINSDTLDIKRFGGTLKAGKIAFTIKSNNWRQVSQEITKHYLKEWANFDGKITLGISCYGIQVDPREVQKVGITLKQKLKRGGVSLRLVPNSEIALSTATSHHNKLGLSLNKVELLIISTNSGETIVAESTGSQNITAYAARDQARPKRDAFVGMLPPKLAQIMINLASPEIKSKNIPPTILDPFCGTGVILQESALMGYAIYGTDLVEKMIEYSHANLDWLTTSHRITFESKLHVGDAMTTTWQKPIDAVVAETYLGQPFSAPPSSSKLTEVMRTCDGIITDFLKNLAPQIDPGTPICIAIPAWRDINGDFSHLPLVETVGRFGYKRHEFQNVSQNDLLYYRENQVVARELLVLEKI